MSDRNAYASLSLLIYWKIMKLVSILAVSITALTLAGCASTPSQSGSPSATTSAPVALTTAKAVKEIKFSIAPEGKASVAENDSFVLADFEKIINADLQNKNLINAQSTDSLDVQITKVRVKHGASAYFGGPLAGADEITAKVTLKGAAGKTEVVSATFTSFGGIFGTNRTDSRLAAMNKEFGEKLALLLVR
jgi:hypothetical protein